MGVVDAQVLDAALETPDFLAKAPDSLRATELKLVTTTYPATVTVRFLAPKLAMKLAVKDWENM